MASYSIAGLPVCYDAAYPMLQNRSEKYRCAASQDAFQLCVAQKEMEDLRALTPLLTDEQREYLLMGAAFYDYLITRGGMMLHASAVVVDHRAFLFSAPSGTGKSTHTSIWLRRFKDAYILNDDKPALYAQGDVVYAAGTPFSGKDDLSVNRSVPVAAIAFIERSETNRIEPITKKRALYELLNQTGRPESVALYQKLLQNVGAILARIPIYKLYCNMEDAAADVSYAAMRKGEKQ